MCIRDSSKLVVCGVGLIGGSAALALRAAGAVDRVVGIGRSRATLDAAQRLGVIDEIAVDWSRALPGAEVVLIAAPVGQMEAISAAMAPFLDPDTIVTDAGSTKRDVVATLRCNLAPHLASVVPAHPIAGAENSGVDAALATLYRDRRVVVTPLPESSPAAIARVFELWRACGALGHSGDQAQQVVVPARQCAHQGADLVGRVGPHKRAQVAGGHGLGQAQGLAQRIDGAARGEVHDPAGQRRHQHDCDPSPDQGVAR